MTPEAQFTADEWAAVTEAPLMAAARVVAADRGGTLRENMAVRRVYVAARELHGESPLLDAVCASPPPHDLGRLLDGGDPTSAGNVRVRAAVEALKARATPEDLDAYKGFVLAVVQTVAEANREGGFAGIGGEEVSAKEQAVLDEITALLEL